MNGIPEMKVADRVLHDVRAIHDSASLPYALEPWPPGSHPDGEWLIIQIQPDSESGSAQHEGVAVDIATGRMVDMQTGQPAGAEAGQLMLVKCGRWEAVAALKRKPAQGEGAYRWSTPSFRRIQILGAEDLYSPFIHGGIALCRYNPGEMGEAEFDPLFLLPPAWSQDAVQAYEIALQGLRPLTGPDSPEGNALLAEFTHSENSVLAVLAFRRLLEAGIRDPRWLNELLQRTHGFRKAVNAYLTATAPETAGEDALRASIAAALSGHMPPEDVRLSAAALVSVSLLRRDVWARREWLKETVGSLLSSVGANDYLQEAYAMLGRP
jgi:hypothetical protein